MKPKDPAKVSAENTLRMETIRQQVIRILQDGFFDVRQLSQELSIMEKEVYNHLEHIQLTLESLNKKLVIKPASCLSCNYVFKDRKKGRNGGEEIDRPVSILDRTEGFKKRKSRD